MQLTEIISRMFSVIFILILFYFILRTLYLMRQDRTAGFADFSVEAARWGLLVLESPEGSSLEPGGILPLDGQLTVGRKRDNDVVLKDPFLSSHHMQFFAEDGRYIIEDLQSTNGTLLNEEPLVRRTYLETGDIISLGSTVLQVINLGGNYA